MPTAAVLGLGGITKQRSPRVPESEPFDIGPIAVASVEPFDVGGVPLVVTSVEPFDMLGAVAVASVEPFDIIGPLDLVLPALDLGDGQVYEASAAPLYGWWEAGSGPAPSLSDLTCE